MTYLLQTAGGGPPLPRSAFASTERWAYLNHAGVAPPSRPALAAMEQSNRSAAAGGSAAGDDERARAEEVRAAAARLMGVPYDDVAFVKNTTEGLGFVASGLAWAAGDRVVVPDHEFPSTIYPWLALQDLGVVVDLVPAEGPGLTIPLEAYAAAIAGGPPPKVVATSWVAFGRGWRTDLAALGRLCRDAGALLCADVIQGLGVIPADFEAWGVDFAMADAHKWLVGPQGIGVLYVRGGRLDLLRPLEPGWSSVSHREQWDDRRLIWDDNARRLEGGTPNVTGTYGLGASIDLLLDAGVDDIWAHVSALGDRLCAGLEAAGATVLSDRSLAGRSAIVSFDVPGMAPADVVARLRDAGVYCSPRAGGVRVSPHGYNTEEEIDRLLAVVASL